MIGHELIDLPWAMAFALGAIVSPTDPVAATTIMRRRRRPAPDRQRDRGREPRQRRHRAGRLQGRGQRRGRRRASRCAEAGLEFVGAAAGGIAIGLAVGFVVAAIRRRLDDPPTEITISLLTGYAAFLPADALGASGVLAAVTAGLYLGWRAPELISPETRLQSYAVWEVLTFLLNATLFILIGLQLP